MQYTYDMGDDWRHRIIVEKVIPADSGVQYPQFLGGERRCPPEDCGGPPGYYEFLDKMAKTRSKDWNAALAWYGGPYEVENIDEQRIIARLRAISCRV